MLVSVVVPFYCGELYIEQCINSVITQPYKDIEILLINDGSPCGGDMCRSLANQYPQIRYIEKENEGIGATRNEGIIQAKGEYIAFLDQDDIWAKGFLDDDTVRVFSGHDIIAFSYYDCNNVFSRGNMHPVELCEIRGGRESIQKTWRHHSSMIFRREYLTQNHILYALSRHEDVIFLHKAAYLANSIQFFNKTMFFYRNNPMSETHRVFFPEEIYIPLLDSWVELLQWHEKEHVCDHLIIQSTKNLICVWAIEGLEALYQSERDELLLHEIAANLFEKYLINYKNDTIIDQKQTDRIRLYFEHYSDFVKKNRAIGKKQRLCHLIIKNNFVRWIYEKRKYKEKLTNIGLY